MTITLELSDELEQRLAKAAARRGLDEPQYVLELLEAHVPRVQDSQALIALMDEWMTQDQEDDGDVPFEQVMKWLDEDRGYRKLFPPELKGVTW
jgi:predicted transcriptional regulator